jgi:two-component system, LytTR family, response regulator
MKETIIISDKKKMFALPIDDILRLEAKGMYTIVYSRNKQQYVSSRHMKVVFADLDPQVFFRIHKTHIINLREVKAYEKGRGGYVLMSDGSTIAVSQRKKAEFLIRFCAR